MNLLALRKAKNDTVANVLQNILVNMAHEPDNRTWKSNLEVAYEYSKRLGTTVGLFSNLPSKLGEPSEELPFFQVQAEKLPARLKNVEGWKDNFGLTRYLGEHYADCAALTAPFLVYAQLLYRNTRNKLWNISVGNLQRNEPLVLTFECQKSLVTLALWGHVLKRDAQLIRDNTPVARSIQLREGWSVELAEYSEERLIHELSHNTKGFPIYSEWAGMEGVVGTYRNVRLEDGRITADVDLLDPEAYPDTSELRITLRQVRDPRRSQTKYKKRYITPHLEVLAYISEGVQ